MLKRGVPAPLLELKGKHDGMATMALTVSRRMMTVAASSTAKKIGARSKRSEGTFGAR